MSTTISNLLGLSDDMFFVAEFIAGALLIYLMVQMLHLFGYLLAPKRWRI